MDNFLPGRLQGVWIDRLFSKMNHDLLKVEPWSPGDC